MKVLVVGVNYAPEPTGIAPYTAALCRGLVERGNSVRVLTTMPHYPEWVVRPGYTGWRRSEQIDGVRVTRLRHYVPRRPSGMRRLLSEVTFGLHAAATAWGRPDVVVFVSPALFSTGIAMLRTRVCGRRSVVWVQDIYSLGMAETRGSSGRISASRLIASFESAVLRSADGVVVIHDRFVKAVERLGAIPARVQVVRNWTHLPERHPGKTRSREQVRDRLRWGDELVVLHSGAMGRKQHLDTVVDAARLAADRGDRIRFVLMGNGGERDRLERLAGGLSTIDFVDPLPGDQFQDALTAADVLLVNEHAGLREMAVPSKLTSYFSSGRPVVAATDAGSVTAQEVEASQAGVRVAPGAPDALLDAVLRIGGDHDLSARLGQAGLAYRRSVLSETFALDQFNAWLEQLSHPHRGSDASGSVVCRGVESKQSDGRVQAVR